MTMALCMNCGNVKFGAICPCAECGVASTGDMRLDIAFSDHHLSARTLKQLGAVVRALREPGALGAQAQEARAQDAEARDAVRFWAFITYVSRNHPSILTADAPPELAPAVNDLLARKRGSLPAVELEGGRTRPTDEHHPSDGRRWWAFWKR